MYNFFCIVLCSIFFVNCTNLSQSRENFRNPASDAQQIQADTGDIKMPKIPTYQGNLIFDLSRCTDRKRSKYTCELEITNIYVVDDIWVGSGSVEGLGRPGSSAFTLHGNYIEINFDSDKPGQNLKDVFSELDTLTKNGIRRYSNNQTNIIFQYPNIKIENVLFKPK